nr:ribonuclease H-like domain-containing protein [Tanacetum cinerariifolium]
MVLDLENVKDAQALEIRKLKKRVKRLKKKRKSRTSQLKRRLFKVRIESAEKSLGDQDDASNQNINLTAAEPVTTVSAPVTTAGGVSVSTAEPSTPHLTTTTLIKDEDITIAQTLMKMRSVKSKEKSKEKEVSSTRLTRGVIMKEASETASRPIVPPQQQLDPKDKEKCIMQEPEKLVKGKDQITLDEEVARRLEAQMQAEIEEKERVARQREKEANLISWNNTQAMMEADYELAQRLQAKEQGELTIEERSKLFVELMDKRKKHFAKLRAEEIRRKPPTKAQKRNQMCTYLKNMANYKHIQLKNKSFEEIQMLFDNTMKWIITGSSPFLSKWGSVLNEEFRSTLALTRQLLRLLLMGLQQRILKLKEYSVARTHQQNEVAERRNRTLFDAARTMLADSTLPTIFWVETVSTACYVQNRVLVVKPHNKTPYALFHGSGPNWLFDIDALTKTMNYQPVVIGTQSNGNVGIKDNNNAGQARKKKEPGKDYILLPLWTVDPPFPQKPKSSQDAGFKPSNDVGKKKTSIKLPDDLDMLELEDISIFKDSNEDVFGAETDLNNLESTFQRYCDKKKARLVAQGHTQEEGIEEEEWIKYDEVFALVARIEAIRLFLAYASFKDFVVYQMDVKSAFLYGKIEEEVYVCQALRFKDLDFHDKVYKVEKALYGLHQASKACCHKFDSWKNLTSHLPRFLFDVGSSRISIFIVNTYVSFGCSGNTTWIMRRTLDISLTFHNVAEDPPCLQALLNGEHECLASIDRAITELVYLVEAHHHLNPIFTPKHDSPRRIDDDVVRLVLEARGILLRFGEVQLSLVALNPKLEVFYTLSDNQMSGPLVDGRSKNLLFFRWEVVQVTLKV